MNGLPITACSGSFFDPGGASGNYGNNQNFTTTICSDNSGSGTHIRLDFSGVALAPGDQLCIYDGNTIAAPLLACADQFAPGSPFVVQATAANPGGCLTVQFISNAAGVAAGWSASLSCVASCQQVLADLVSTLPAMIPADTGWIDICPGKRVTFQGQGIYPQNGFAYQQSDFSTEFEWNFGDGGIAYGPTVSHLFEEPGGYYVQLFLKDTLGCRSTNLLSQRVRVAPRPNFSIANAFAPVICAGDTIQLSAVVSDTVPGANLSVTGGQLSFTVDGTRSDSLALPDGTGIPYETNLYFTEFSPGQVLTNVDDLEGICVNMEHSWMRDIEIKLTCPNGTTVILHNHPGQIGGQVFLGEPNDNDNFNPIPGAGYDYCWTPNAPNPTWIQFANTTLGGFGTLPPGDYSSFTPLTNLIGCPLNGEWTLTVTDLWPIDNGFIFSWGIDFNDLLYPNVETFAPDLVSWQWANHPSIFFQTPDSIAAAPQNAGTATYRFTVTDEFGCPWDTTLSIAVLPFTHPNCFSCQYNYNNLVDTVICTNESVQLDGTANNGAPAAVRFEAAPGYQIGNANHPHNNAYASDIAVNSVGYAVLNNPITQIQSVCVDLNTDFAADIFLRLRSPNGQLLELSTGNGGSGDNYKITCFTPTAVTPITAGAAPFNGNFQPEGAWSALNNAQVNGNWQLLVSDGFGLNQFGRLNWWSIGFNLTNNTTYAWNPTTGLSCTNCPNPIATPAVTTAYVMTATDAFNCVYRDTANITVQNFFPAPASLTMIGMDNGNMVWQWNSIPGVTTYEVNVNNTGWVTVNSTTFTVTGLIPGQLVQIQVRAQGGTPACPPAIVNADQVYIDCTLDLTLDNTFPTTCPGGSDGAILATATGGQGQTVFYSSFGPATPYTNGNLTFFPAGAHFVFAVDAAGCRDTVFFNIVEPNPFAIATSATAVSCAGGNNGSATATASGGTGTLTYLWQSAGGPLLSGATITILTSGTYILTITDQAGCSATATQSVPANPPITFTTAQDSVSCFGGNDGTATVNVGGGAGGYAYLWSNGDTGATADQLSATLHSVTVTDAAGCNATTLVQVLQPPLLVLDSLVAAPESCHDANNGLVGAYPSGGVGPYTFQWSGTNQTGATITSLDAGIYQLTVTDQNACTVSGQAIVTAPPALAFTVSNLVNVSCLGACDGAVALSAGGGTFPYSINWSTPGVPANALSANNLCAGNYTVTLIDGNNCSAAANFVITAPPALQIQLQTVAPSCPGIFNGQITAQASGGSGGYTYLWSDGQNTATAAALDCQTYTVTVTDSNNCPQTASATLICPDALQITNISAAPVLCFGQNNGSAAVVATGGAEPYQYNWSDPLAQTTQVATGLAALTYTVTVTDQAGCNVNATVTITSPDLLTASATIVPVSCFGFSDGAISTTTAGGTPGYGYQWSNGAAAAAIQNLPAGVYSLTVSDQNGCSTTVNNLTVGQPTGPVTLTVQQTKIACFEAGTGVAEALATGSNGGPFDYQWSNNDTGPQANGLSLGTYTVTATDVQGCSATQTIQITQYDSISANIGTVPPTCNGYNDGQAFVNNVIGGAGNNNLGNYSYQWGGQPGAPADVYWGAIIGGLPFTLTISDPQGCSNTFSLVLPNPTAVTPILTATDVLCHGGSDGTASVVDFTGDHPIVQYLWSNGATVTAIDSLLPGAYRVTITDTRGCSGAATALINQPDPLRLTFSQTPLKCPGDTIGALMANVTGGIPAYGYAWSNTATAAAIGQLTSGVYTVTITDANNCLLIDSTQIAEPAPAVLDLEASDVSCFGLSDGRIEVSITNGVPPYRYAIGNADFNGSPIFLALPAGQYAVKVIDNNACITTDTVSVFQPAPIVVSISPAELSLVYGDSIQLTASSTGAVEPVQYQWSADILETFYCGDLFCETVGLIPSIDNTIRVTAVDAHLCSGEALIRMDVSKPRDIYVPTGFTPNNDGANDLLHVFGKSRQVKSIRQFRVYDRWGELIYEDLDLPVNDTNRGWDGTFRGKACEPGVYVWTLEVEYTDGAIDSFFGNTTLIR